MKKINIILLALIGLCVISCLEENFDPVEKPSSQIHFSNTVQPVAIGDIDNKTLPPFATKALIDAQTSVHIQSNFLRINEIVDEKTQAGTYQFPRWSMATLLEASVISSPGNEMDNFSRAITLNPIQSYNIYCLKDPQDPENEKLNDTTFYHTRMVGWYPVTCMLNKIDGVAANTRFDHFVKANVGYDAYTEDEQGKKITIHFSGLNGRQDIMVTEVREAQYWHFDNRKKQDDGIQHPINKGDIDPADNGHNIYRQPFGRSSGSPIYDNCFDFKHYMSAVKIYAYADKNLNEQNATMWGRIEKVVVRDQPDKCSVTLPEFDVKNPNAKIFGTAKFTGKSRFTLEKTPMYGDDANAEEHDVAPDNPTLEGWTKEKPLYLGYAMIADKPGLDLKLDIHTESGIYTVTIPKLQKSGTAPDEVTEEVFKAGFIYKIKLNFGTGGRIAAMLVDDSQGRYYDLTTGDEWGTDKNFNYMTANCYIVDPSQSNILIKDAKTGKTPERYDGYTFLATTIGNGSEGLVPNIPHKTADIKPVSAGLIWESELGLITHVEYMYNYVRFKVPSQTREGNAVIGVYDKNGKVLWSWHIWVTDQPNPMGFNLLQSGATEQTVTFMDRNLGAVDPYTESGSANRYDLYPLTTYGLYYQWGRKDPSMSPPGISYRPLSTECFPYYDYYGNKKTATAIKTTSRPTIMDGVENPEFLIIPTEIPPYYQYDWLFERNDDLWGEKSMKKTIYDPCPYGYRVPDEEIRTLISTKPYTIEKTREHRAIIFDDVDGLNSNRKMSLPYAGYKGVDRGMSSLSSAWKYVGEKGDYQSTGIYTNNEHRKRAYISYDNHWKESGTDANGDGIGDLLFEYSGNYFGDYANRRTAATVRCIKDGIFTKYGQIFSIFNVNPVTVFLGKEYTLTYGMLAEDSKINGIKLDQIGKKTNTVFERNSLCPPYKIDPATEGKVIENTANKLQVEKKIIAGTEFATQPMTQLEAEKNYDGMGRIVYHLTGKNDKNISADRSITVNVVNLSEIYDVMIGDTPQPLNTGFIEGSNEYLSLKINMHEPGVSGQKTTSVEELQMLYNNLKTEINGKMVGVIFDKNSKRFYTDQPIRLTKDIIIAIKSPDGTTLKSYKMAGTPAFEIDHQVVNFKGLQHNKYYCMSAWDNKTPPGLKGHRFWYHTPDAGAENHSMGLEYLQKIGGKEYLEEKNIFILECSDPSSGQNGYWKLYADPHKYIDRYFGAGTKYEFRHIDDKSGMLRFAYFDGALTYWGVQYMPIKDVPHSPIYDSNPKAPSKSNNKNNEIFCWSNMSTPAADYNKWYVYEVNPVLKYKDPVLYETSPKQ